MHSILGKTKVSFNVNLDEQISNLNVVAPINRGDNFYSREIPEEGFGRVGGGWN
jgi:hypothetical protein